MEKYSQFRDRSTGISPFLPVLTPVSRLSMLTHGLLFVIRLPFFLTYALTYFLIFHYLPLPVVARKIALWCLMSISGIWWVDLQLDGVRRGTLSEQPPERVPRPGSVIAVNFTSPIDAVYLSAVFDPVFTVSYPGSLKLQRVGLLGAAAAALTPVRTAAPAKSKLVDIEDLLKEYPDRVIALFPECGTTNGKAILPLSPALAQCPPSIGIFPVSIRYTPSNVTTPIPGQSLRFLWNLLSHPTTCIRVCIAECQYRDMYGAMVNQVMAAVASPGDHLRYRRNAELSDDEQAFLNRIAEALARLSRVKRVGLTINDKAAFVAALKGKRP